jgi:hypothetical protein
MINIFFTGLCYALKSSTQGIAKVTLDGTTLKIEWTEKAHAGAKKTATNINLDSLIVNA